MTLAADGGANLEQYRAFIRDYDGSIREISQKKLVLGYEERNKIIGPV